KAVATSGVLAALAVVILLLGSLIELLDLSAAAMASLVIMVAVIDLGIGYAAGVYAVAAVLSVLLFPKTATIVFAAFVGYYPIVKVYLDRIKPRLLQYTVKLVLFNTFLFAILWLVEQLLGAGNDWSALGVPLYVLGNLTFLVFDLAIARLSLFYIHKIKRRFQKR
ncbi:MAG: hypothetical protein IJD82_08530, partial [Clostridia bacterium]|nr:hypothetical protein [Clostridia bacterium]